MKLKVWNVKGDQSLSHFIVSGYKKVILLFFVVLWAMSLVCLLLQTTLWEDIVLSTVKGVESLMANTAVVR